MNFSQVWFYSAVGLWQDSSAGQQPPWVLWASAPRGRRATEEQVVPQMVNLQHSKLLPGRSFLQKAQWEAFHGEVTRMWKVGNLQVCNPQWDLGSLTAMQRVESLNRAPGPARAGSCRASALPPGLRRLHSNVAALSPNQEHQNAGIRVSSLPEDIQTCFWELSAAWGRLPNNICRSLSSRVHLGTVPICLLIFIFIFHNKMLNMNYGYSTLNCNKSCIFHLLGYSSLSDTLYCLPEYFYKVFASFNL